VQNEHELTEELRLQAADSSKMIDSILEVKSTGSNNYDSLSLLYQRIYTFLVFKNKILSQQNTAGGYSQNSSMHKSRSSDVQTTKNHHDSIQREVNAALESVIPRNALSPFIMLTSPEKATQLSELSNLVLGIRLFNKEIGKGGASLPGVDSLMSRLGRDFLEAVDSHMKEVGQLIEDYSNFLEYLLENGISDPQEEYLKDELIYLRQHFSYVSNLLEKTETALSFMEASESRFNKEVDDLRSLLANNSSAPKEQVYPKFSTLASTYLSILEESKLGPQKVNLLEILSACFAELRFSLTEAQTATAQRVQEIKRHQEEEKPLRYDIRNQVYFIEPKNTPEFMQTPLDLSGFSLVGLVDNYILNSGKHSLGVFKYKDFMLVFKNHIEISLFLENPNRYLEGLYIMCRKNPALILLLGQEEYFRQRGLRLLDIKEYLKDSATTLQDSETQTEIHVSDEQGRKGHIDHNYFWNEWELRKQAIKMANIRNMTTKASQTNDSIFKVENETQVWLKKEATTMTGIEKGTNPIRPRNYITELREKTSN
jgi:Domain of unknown function